MIQIGDYVICRAEASSSFAGILLARCNREVTLAQARRLWYWEGAASLSQLAQSGTSTPSACKFPEEVNEVIILDAIEILACTPRAKATIDEVPVWSA